MKRGHGGGNTAHRATPGHDASLGSIDPAKDMNADELRRDIERTREDLGHTVQGLAAKADVKARAARVVDGSRQAVSHAPAKAANTARTAVRMVGPRRLAAGAGSALAAAGAVWGATRALRARRAARNRGLRRFLHR